MIPKLRCRSLLHWRLGPSVESSRRVVGAAMAGTWRVLIESLHDLGNASYRVGDHLKLIGHSLQGGDGNDPRLRNLVVEVKSGTKTMRTPPFSAAVGQGDVITLNQVR
eukprot:s2902_g5.t1